MMEIKQTGYLGIDMGSGSQPFTYAALSYDKRLLSIGSGRIEELNAFLSSFPSALAAISTPARPGYRSRPKPPTQKSLLPPQDDAGNTLPIDLTKSLPQPRVILSRKMNPNLTSPAWILSVRPLIEQLSRLNYCFYPAENSSHLWLETQSDACFTTLIGHSPYPAKSLEGRLQRQMVLCENGLPLKDPMDFLEEVTPYRLIKGTLPLQHIRSPAELNALVAAYIAWLIFNRNHLIMRLGQAEDEPIYLPVWRNQESTTRRAH